jgi:16S rRNA processing protein RimM
VLLEVGQVVRAHGLHGELVVRLISNRDDRMSPGSTLFAGERRLVVSSARRLPARGDTWSTHWLTSFAGISDRSTAEVLAGALLQADVLPGGEGLWVHELIGSTVVSTSGAAHGRVEAVEANPASDLLVLDTGALVPLCFVVAAEPGRVVVEVPEGLFEL